MGKRKKHSAGGISGSKREGEGRVGESEGSTRHSGTDSTGEGPHEVLLSRKRIPTSKDNARAERCYTSEMFQADGRNILACTDSGTFCNLETRRTSTTALRILVDVSSGREWVRNQPSEEALHQRAEPIPGEAPIGGGGMPSGAGTRAICGDKGWSKTV